MTAPVSSHVTYHPMAPRYQIWANPPSAIEEAAIAAKSHSIFTANRSRIVRSCRATAAFAHGYVSVSQAIDRISGLITATERRPLDLPAQRRRRAPRRGSSQHLPICEQGSQALFLFDVWCLHCEPIRATRRYRGRVYGGQTARQRTRHQWDRFQSAQSRQGRREDFERTSIRSVEPHEYWAPICASHYDTMLRLRMLERKWMVKLLWLPRGLEDVIADCLCL